MGPIRRAERPHSKAAQHTRSSHRTTNGRPSSDLNLHNPDIVFGDAHYLKAWSHLTPVNVILVSTWTRIHAHEIECDHIPRRGHGIPVLSFLYIYTGQAHTTCDHEHLMPWNGLLTPRPTSITKCSRVSGYDASCSPKGH